ncbi:ADP-ribosylation factor-like protein 2 [Paramecium bursaria]
MGLLKIIKKTKEREKEMRLLILGLDNAGKTTILKKFNGEDISQISPTLGFNIKTLQYKHYKLNVWDVGGQTTIRTYWRNYFEQTDGVIWVVDSTDKARLDDCKRELVNILKQEKLIGATLLIFCNKQDVLKALSLQQIREYLELDLIETRHWGVIACSAVTGQGLIEGIDWIVSDIASRIFMMS